MPERFVEWCPVASSEPTVSLLSLHDDHDGLVVRVESAGRTIEISFGIVVAFRSTLEECCLGFWEHFHRTKPEPGAFWTVEDSAWLAAFSEADLCLYRQVTHYLIITHDERIDVISPRAPVVRIIDAG